MMTMTRSNSTTMVFGHGLQALVLCMSLHFFRLQCLIGQAFLICQWPWEVLLMMTSRVKCLRVWRPWLYVHKPTPRFQYGISMRLRYLLVSPREWHRNTCRRFGDDAARTLDTTTQLIHQDPDSSLSRSAGTNDRHVRYWKINSTFFTDTMFARQHMCAILCIG